MSLRLRKRRPADLGACLRDPRRYEREIDRLHNKHLFTRTLYDLQQENVTLACLIQRRTHVAKLLARAVARDEYRLEPGTVREIEADGKKRTVVAYRLTDTIVTGVVSAVIDEAMRPALSGRLYSYRPEVSWLQPSADLAAYIREHRRARPDPRSRGLYVLRRDVDSYTDSIPVGPTSRVWPLVREVLAAFGSESIAAADWSLVEQTIRPTLHEQGGGLAMRTRGVPTGQPISCVLFNLYLNELDHALAAIPGAFYARYSDDILFAHPDAATARAAAARIATTVSALGLHIKEDKAENLHLNAAGRPSDDWEEAEATTCVSFVGTSVSATGTVALNRKKLRRALREVELRAVRAARALRGGRLAEVGSTVCSVVNEALSTSPTPVQQASAPLLRRAITDRGQLAQVDYCLARIVLKAVTGDGDVRAFRRIPYRTIRNEWGLVSLAHARNRSRGGSL